MTYKIVKVSMVCAALAISNVGCGDNTTSDQHLASGLAHQNKGDKKSAVIEYKNALKKDPQNLPARLALGLIYQQDGELAAAKKELAHALTKESTRRDAIIPYASVLSDMGEAQEILELPLLATSLSNENMIKAHYLRGKAFARLETPDLGRAEFTTCTELEPENRYAKLCQATVALLDEKLELASQLAQTLVTENPDMAEALLLSGSIYSADKQYAKAASVYQQHIKVHKKQTGLINLLLAEALVNSGQIDDANVEIDAILAINPLQPLANYLKARISFEQENFSLALLHASNTVKANPSHYPANLIGGISAFRESELEQSYRMLSKIESQISGITLPVIMNIINNLRLGNISHARLLLKDAGKLASENVTLFMIAANEFSIAQDYKSALAIYQKIRVITPDSNTLKFAMGKVKLQLGDRSALTDLHDTLLDPKHVNQSMLLLSAVYIKTGQQQKLTEMATLLKKELPQSKEGWLLAGSIAVEAKDYALARKEFSHILTLEDGSLLAYSHLSKIAAHQEDYEQALVNVDHALAIEPNNLNLVMLKAKIVYSKTQDHAQAEQVVIDTYEQFSDENDLIVERALIHAKHKDIKQALLLLASISDKEPLSNKYWDSYAMILMADKRNGEALSIYQQWAVAKPNVPAPLLKQIALTEQMRLYDQGLNIIVQGQENFGHIPEFHLLEVSFAILAKKVKKARAKFNSLTVESQQQENYNLVFGELLVAEQAYQKAIDVLLPIYENTKALRPLRPLTQAYVALKQQKLMIPLVEGHLSNSPTAKVLLPVLASAYTNEGQRNKALDLYQQLLVDYPKHPAFLNNVAWLLYEKGELENALDYVKRASELTKDNAQILDTHAVILLKLGKLDDAAEKLAQARALLPKDFSINAHYAQVEIARGKLAQAKRLLNRVVAQTDDEKKLFDEVNKML